MADVVTLTCLSCGGRLEITQDIDRFACAHCGTEHLVRRGGGIVSLALVLQEIAEIEAKVDRTASQLAIERLKEDVEELEKGVISNRDAKWGAITWCILGLLGFVVAATMPSSPVDWGLVVGCGLAMVVFSAVCAVMALGARERAKKLDKLLSKKRTEIKRHRQIIRATSNEQP